MKEKKKVEEKEQETEEKENDLVTYCLACDTRWRCDDN